MRFSISTAFLPTDQLLPIARAADELGYHSLAIPDHVVDLETLSTPYPYTPDGARRWDHSAEWPDPWVLVGALAAVAERTWTVAPGDHLWSIASRVLSDAWGRPPSDVEVVPFWEQVVELNRDRLADPANPDLIFPGQSLVVPAPPPAPA